MNYNLVILGLGVLLVGVAFFVGDKIFNVQLYDTYFLIGWSGLLRLVGLVCILLGGSYVLANRKQAT